ncbi:ATP-binding protein [Paenibacillus naphthalenovorans]
MEAMDEQGGYLKISAGKEKDNVILQISDTGPGMTEEQIRRLGTPYFSKNMTGKVVIHSELGRGTDFTLIFPAALQPSTVSK